jgi:integrase
LVDKGGEPRFNFHLARCLPIWIHGMSHFAASQWIELGFSSKRLQALLEHSSIQTTFDKYGHLFPSPEDDHEKFARSEIGLVA